MNSVQEVFFDYTQIVCLMEFGLFNAIEKSRLSCSQEEHIGSKRNVEVCWSNRHCQEKLVKSIAIKEKIKD